MTDRDEAIEQSYSNPVPPPSHRRFIRDEYGHEIIDSVACPCPIGHNHDKIEVDA